MVYVMRKKSWGKTFMPAHEVLVLMAYAQTTMLMDPVRPRV